jgi:hypothetical protein
MKRIFVIAIMLCVSITFAQEEKNVTYIDNGDLTEATYYYDNGVIQQEGTFNKAGKLHGVWTSYDINGDKVTVGKYMDGKKVGKWFFWTKDNVIKEVDYDNSKITSVNERVATTF